MCKRDSQPMTFDEGYRRFKIASNDRAFMEFIALAGSAVVIWALMQLNRMD